MLYWDSFRKLNSKVQFPMECNIYIIHENPYFIGSHTCLCNVLLDIKRFMRQALSNLKNGINDARHYYYTPHSELL